MKRRPYFAHTRWQTHKAREMNKYTKLRAEHFDIRRGKCKKTHFSRLISCISQKKVVILHDKRANNKKLTHISLQNQNIICLSCKNRALVAKTNYCIFGRIVSELVKVKYKNNALRERCSFLYYRRCDVFGFGEIEFLTDLG